MRALLCVGFKRMSLNTQSSFVHQAKLLLSDLPIYPLKRSSTQTAICPIIELYKPKMTINSFTVNPYLPFISITQSPEFKIGFKPVLHEINVKPQQLLDDRCRIALFIGWLHANEVADCGLIVYVQEE